MRPGVCSIRAWREPPFSLAVGSHETSAMILCTWDEEKRRVEKTRDPLLTPSSTYSSILAPRVRKEIFTATSFCSFASSKYGYAILHPVTYVIEAFWTEHNPSCRSLRPAGGGCVGTCIVHTFDPIVDTTLYTIMIYVH